MRGEGREGRGGDEREGERGNCEGEKIDRQ